ncbi:MAG: peptide chain release factor N(5)-glutamine methyltransferase [Candidatus Aenigmarchaeota archaeon]|nr:peptide chain release factor N(5)-glutamine methyltransferase [Candidatus Aenigmarchaeota archaeon]
MTIKELLQSGNESLSSFSDNPQLDSELLLGFIVKKTKHWLYMHEQELINNQQKKQWQKLIKQRQQGKPIAYLISQKEFYGLNFFVNQHVLIPRPESELLIEQILLHHPINESLIIADIGTGSGCLAITLAKYLPNAIVYAADISVHALSVAKKNARQHQVKINFRRGNLLKPLRNLKIDLVIANLPYLSPTVYRQTSMSIQKYEPKLALLSANNGLFYYQQLLAQIGSFFPSVKQIFLEIDSRQNKQIKTIIKQSTNQRISQAKIKISKDLQQQDRVVSIFI